MTVTSKEQARQKQLDFLESMKVFEEVYEDELLAGTHVMSGRWVDTMKTSMWRSKCTAGGCEEPHSDEGCFAATATIQGVRMLLAGCLPEGWNPKILMDGRRVVWKVREAMLGLRTSPRRWQEDLSSKLKEHGFVQKERDPCVCEHGT